MNRSSFVNWLLIGVLAGLGLSSHTLVSFPDTTADLARWSILLTVTATTVVLSTLWQPSNSPRWWLRFARLLAISGWVVLVAGYPLWVGGEFYGLSWSLSVYSVISATVLEFHRQIRRQETHLPILAESRLLFAVIACVSMAHLAVYLTFQTFSTLVLLLATAIAGMVACFADTLLRARTMSV